MKKLFFILMLLPGFVHAQTIKASQIVKGGTMVKHVNGSGQDTTNKLDCDTTRAPNHIATQFYADSVGGGGGGGIAPFKACGRNVGLGANGDTCRTDVNFFVLADDTNGIYSYNNYQNGNTTAILAETGDSLITNNPFGFGNIGTIVSVSTGQWIPAFLARIHGNGGGIAVNTTQCPINPDCGFLGYFSYSYGTGRNVPFAQNVTVDLITIEEDGYYAVPGFSNSGVMLRIGRNSGSHAEFTQWQGNAHFSNPLDTTSAWVKDNLLDMDYRGYMGLGLPNATPTERLELYGNLKFDSIFGIKFGDGSFLNSGNVIAFDSTYFWSILHIDTNDVGVGNTFVVKGGGMNLVGSATNPNLMTRIAPASSSTIPALSFGFMDGTYSFLWYYRGDIDGDLELLHSTSGGPIATPIFHITRNEGNVGIGGIPATNTILDVASTTKFSRPIPPMTQAQRDAVSPGPTAGDAVYCTDCTANDASTGVNQTYNGSTWKNWW